MEPHFYSHAQERNEKGSCVLAHAERLKEGFARLFVRQFAMKFSKLFSLEMISMLVKSMAVYELFLSVEVVLCDFFSMCMCAHEQIQP